MNEHEVRMQEYADHWEVYAIAHTRGPLGDHTLLLDAAPARTRDDAKIIADAWCATFSAKLTIIELNATT